MTETWIEQIAALECEVCASTPVERLREIIADAEARSAERWNVYKARKRGEAYDYDAKRAGEAWNALAQRARRELGRRPTGWRRVRLAFDSAPDGVWFEAWTDGSRWNGALNAWLTEADAVQFAEHVRLACPGSPPVRIAASGIVWPYPSEEERLQSGPLTVLGPGSPALYSFAGGAGVFPEVEVEVEVEELRR